jgi:ABC-2 type transport system ATP-binding protein
MTCDRVGMIFAGRLRSVGPLASLLSARLLSTEVVLRPGPGGLPALPAQARKRQSPEGVMIELPESSDVDAFLTAALSAGASVLSVSPRKESLEDLFLREARVEHRDPPAPLEVEKRAS